MSLPGEMLQKQVSVNRCLIKTGIKSIYLLPGNEPQTTTINAGAELYETDEQQQLRLRLVFCSSIVNMVGRHDIHIIFMRSGSPGSIDSGCSGTSYELSGYISE
jgi:hypothetical protein